MLSAEGRVVSPTTSQAAFKLENSANISQRQLQDLGLSPTIKNHQKRLAENEYNEMVHKYNNAMNLQKHSAKAAATSHHNHKRSSSSNNNDDTDIIMDDDDDDDDDLDADFNIFSYAETKSMKIDFNEDIIIPKVYGCPETPIEGTFNTQAANQQPIINNYAYNFEEDDNIICRKGGASNKAAAAAAAAVWSKANNPIKNGISKNNHKVTKKDVIQSLKLNLNHNQTEPRFVPNLKNNDFSSIFDGENKPPNGA